MTEAFVDGVKHTIRNLMYCAKVLEDSKPLEAFLKVSLRVISIVNIVRKVMILSSAEFIPR